MIPNNTNDQAHNEGDRSLGGPQDKRSNAARRVRTKNNNNKKKQNNNNPNNNNNNKQQNKPAAVEKTKPALWKSLSSSDIFECMSALQQLVASNPEHYIKIALKNGDKAFEFDEIVQEYLDKVQNEQITVFDSSSLGAETPLPVTTADTVVGQQIHPLDYGTDAGRYKSFKRATRRFGHRIVQAVDSTFSGHSHPRVVERQRKIDRLDDLLENSCVTRLMITSVNGDCYVQYHHSDGEIPTDGRDHAPSREVTLNMRGQGTYKVHHLSYFLMMLARNNYGMLKRTDQNIERVRTWIQRTFKQLRSSDDPEVKLIRREDLYDIQMNAVYMFFIPTRNDLIRHQLTQEKWYRRFVAMNNRIAPLSTGSS
jgi:hypothetical protein